MRERGRATRWAVPALAAAYAAPLAVLLVRAAAEVWRAPARWPQQLGTRGARQLLEPGIASAVGNSLVIAVMTTALAVVVGWGAARLLGGRDRASRRALYVLVALPLLVPPYAAGWASRPGSCAWGWPTPARLWCSHTSSTSSPTSCCCSPPGSPAD